MARSVPTKLPKQPKHILGKKLRKKEKLEIQEPLEPRRITDRELRDKKGLEICPKCGAIYYDKKWYKKSELKKHLEKRKELEKTWFSKWFAAQPKKDKICPACSQRKDWSEGVVYIQGLTPKIKTEVLRLVDNVNKRANKRDAEDRIIKIEDKGRNVIIYTSENQLAFSIGKQLSRAFKKGSLEIKFSHNEDALRIYWTAP